MCLILAKIHMVTKLSLVRDISNSRLILAKIHMVTKHSGDNYDEFLRLILAKIHMVTKPYGNKTSNTCYHIFKNNKILSILNSYRYIKFSFYIIFYHSFCLLKCTYSFIYINIIYLLIII